MKTTYTLHGFLGLQTDWSQHDLLTAAVPVDLTSISSPRNGLKAWGAAFNQFVDKEGKRVVIGYSLGGRLALHAIAENPTLWDAAVIISAHPGLKTQQEKEDRLNHDRQWASRFLTEEWDLLIQAWNNQAVFAGDNIKLLRRESDYDRLHLAVTLVGWSLGKQEDLTEKIANAPFPILWMAGSRDKIYSTVAKNLTFSHPRSKVCIVPKSGHRVPWENPKFFQKEVSKFLDSSDT